MSKPPKRWLNYTPIGEQIEGTNIVSFKVPLDPRINVPNHSRFNWNDVFRKHPELKLVIDLTFTFKYYDPQELIRRNVEHEKLWCAGRVVPDEGLVRRFITAIDNFNASNEGVIGVHCTHGVNRTGYLVCRYLIERLKLSPEEAIRRFESARKHAIERQNYVQDLYACGQR